VARDPRNVSRYDWLAGFLIGLGRLDEAQRAIETAIAMQPDASGFHSQLAMIQTLRGNEAAALAEARLETPGPWRNIALTMAMQIGADRATADEALQALIRDDAETSAYQIAQIHALRYDAEHTFEWLDRAWANRDSGIVYLLYDPFIMRYRDDARLAAFCAKVGLPAPAGTRPRTAAAASDEKIR
jgi:hypothetical protein